MQWYLKCLRQFTDFKGRARRKEYWMFTLFNMIFAFAAMLLDNIFGIADPELGYGLIYGFYTLGVFVPSLAVAVRRLHDTDHSGWMILIAFIPIIGAIWLLVLFVKEGDKGSNRFGPDPKSESQTGASDEGLIDAI
ncbi:MAG: DUF805 domain-containing protein [Crocinitomicaceae bacterium]|nr:DUF805 domain-containing protein [Crocinitomicaceae bacterium]